MSPDRLYRVMRMLGTSPRGFIWRMHRSSSVYAIFLVHMPRHNGIRICTRMHPRCSPLTYGPAFIPGTDGGRPRAACLELRLRRFRAACRDGVGSEDGQRRHRTYLVPFTRRDALPRRPPAGNDRDCGPGPGYGGAQTACLVERPASFQRLRQAYACPRSIAAVPSPPHIEHRHGCATAEDERGPAL